MPEAEKEKIRRALLSLAATGSGSSRGGKRLKTIQGTEAPFHRLRVGDWRVMFDLLPDEGVLLVLGIVNRRELERWLRSR